MSEVFKIVDIKEEKKEYPKLPFVVKDKYGKYFLVCKDNISKNYRYVELGEGVITNMEFSSLEDMQNKYPDDKILNIELLVKNNQ